MRNRLLGCVAVLMATAGYSYGSCTASSPYACTGGSLNAAATPNMGGSLGSSAQTVSGLTGSIATVTVTLTNWTDNGSSPGSGTSDREFMLVFQPTGGGTAQTFQFLGGMGAQGYNFTNDTFTFADGATTYAPDTYAYCGSGCNPSGYTHDQPPVNGATYKPTVNTAYADCSSNSQSGSGAQFGSPAPASAPCAAANPYGPNETNGGTATFASQFSGNPNGTWTLYIWTNADAEDSAASIGSWIVTITTQANAANTTTTLSSNATNNETTEGTSVTLTATINSTSTVSQGTVDFTDNGNTILGCGAQPVSNGTATCTTSFSTEGNHPLEAAYSGGTNFGTSHGTLNFFVDHPTTNPSPGQYCNTGTITINTVTAPGSTPYPQHITIPTQTGTLSDVSLTLPNITTDSNGGIADYNFLLVDPNGRKFIPLSAAGGFGAAHSVTLTLSDFGSGTVPNPTSSSASSGTYLPTDDNGGLSFPSGTPSGPYGLPQNQGGATFDTTFGGSNPTGQWSLYVYDTSGQQTGSIGGYCLNITTSNAASTTTSVTSSPNGEATTGQSVTFTATVKQSSNNAVVTGGTVTFKENGTTLSGPTSLNGSGQATFVTSSLAEGIHTITANYSGVTGTYNVSSGTVTIEIDTPTTNPSTGVYCNPGGITGANGGTNAPATPYPSRINVTNLPGTVNSVAVQLNNFSDGDSQGTSMLLEGPTATNIVFWNLAGGSNGFSNLNLTMADSAGSSHPVAEPPANNATYYPTSNQINGFSSPVFPAPAPVGLSFAPPQGTQTFTSAFQNINPNGYWDLYVYDRFGADATQIGKWCLNFTENPPVLAITETGPTSAEQGQTGLQYTITVTNNGPGSTAGTITVTPSSSSGLTLTGLSSTDNNWTCSVSTPSCTRTAPIAAGSGNATTITATYSVANNATSPQTASASVSGGGSTGTVTTNPAASTNITAAATVTNVSSTTANGSYTVGAVISITVTFSKPVTVTGTPQLALNSGGIASYTSGSGTSTLTFTYTVAAGQNSTHLDYSTTSALTLNGGSINDSSSLPAHLTLPAPGATGSLSANTNIVIDTTAPTVTSFNVLFGSQSYNLISSARADLPWQVKAIQVVFSKPIGTAGTASLSGVSASGLSGLGTNTLTWTLSSPLTIASGVTATLATSGANAVKDAAGNTLTGSNTSETFSVLYGDFNADGSVSSADMVGVQNATAQPYNIFADINGDGLVTTADTQIVRSRIGTHF